MAGARGICNFRFSFCLSRPRQLVIPVARFWFLSMPVRFCYGRIISQETKA